mmetsp:Transcript_5300/g.7721  ORF Transcript_5300/g.7721 Transcript_5300/m.7721 type:complete len:252 (+) Transcript_5300:65-820(+)
MNVIALALLGLTCGGDGRRMHMTNEHLRRMHISHMGGVESALASLLLANSPVAGWQLPGSGRERTVGKHKACRSCHVPTLPIRMALDIEDNEKYQRCMSMRATEIKAELDMRGVTYPDTAEKTDLARLLAEARTLGKADAKVLDDFNKQNLERTFQGEKQVKVEDMDEDIVKGAIAGDGGLPGGTSPEMLQAMMSNPELMAMLQNPKLQEVMKSVMTHGPEGALKDMQDPEVKDMLWKINQVVGKMKQGNA